MRRAEGERSVAYPCSVLTILLSLCLSSTLALGGGPNGLASFSVFSAPCKLPIFLLPGPAPPRAPPAEEEAEPPSRSRGVCSLAAPSGSLSPLVKRDELLGFRGKQHGKRHAAKEDSWDDTDEDGILQLRPRTLNFRRELESMLATSAWSLLLAWSSGQEGLDPQLQ